MSPPVHICPKCKQPYSHASFLNARGQPTKWCQFCRAAYRDRLTNLHQHDKTKPKRGEVIDVDGVVKTEGYETHPLAQLLALSHIAGAKRALAIRDGKSWRGKKAWRAYYEAKAALEAQLEQAQQLEKHEGRQDGIGNPGQHAETDHPVQLPTR